MQAVDYTQGRKENELSKISLIELLLGCLDRELQDFHQENQGQVKYLDSIDKSIDIFLQIGIDNLEFYPKLASITYILIALLSTLNNRLQFKDNHQRGNEKIYRTLLVINSLLLTSYKERLGFNSRISDVIMNGLLDERRQMTEYEKSILINFLLHEKEREESNETSGISRNNANLEEKKVIYKLNNHIEEDDFFKLANLKISLSNDVDDIRQKAGGHDIYSIVDQLLIFDEVESDSIWHLEIQMDNKKNEYEAVEFSRYIYILSEALQTIGDLDITIDDTGMGSVWIKLKIRVKTLASEIDFKQVIEQAQLYIDAGMHSKPVTELKKTLAESKKIDAETSKILEETKQLKESENRKKIEELEVYDKYLDLRKKALEISKDEEELKQLKLKNLHEISEIISRETLNLDSDIQIQINDLGFISKKRGEILTENSTDIVESLKAIEPKKEIEHSEEGFE